MKKIAVFSPALSTTNLGDEIIWKSCQKVLYNIFSNDFLVKCSTHVPLGAWAKDILKNVDFKFIAGSNLLGKQSWLKKSQWNNFNAFNYKMAANSILLGVGWRHYLNKKPTFFTKYSYGNVLSKDYLHSVRDEFTAEKLKDLGFKNVINTGYPSIWDLTPEHCEKIPQTKSEKALTILIDSDKDFERDTYMLNTLLKNYSEVYIWIQGIRDYEYLQELNFQDKLKIIPPNLKAYDEILEKEQVDFIGPRLHGGIRALQHAKRSIIIAVDNRATEMSKDFNLPILQREHIADLDNLINSKFKTEIKPPIENINKWKTQFN